eukprot:768236-Hanusia_phi.AAC.3
MTRFLAAEAGEDGKHGGEEEDGSAEGLASLIMCCDTMSGRMQTNVMWIRTSKVLPRWTDLQQGKGERPTGKNLSECFCF